MKYRDDFNFEDLAEFRQSDKELLPMITSLAEEDDKVQRASDLLGAIEELYLEALALLVDEDDNNRIRQHFRQILEIMQDEKLWSPMVDTHDEPSLS